MDIEKDDLILLDDGMYYIIDSVNHVHETVHLRYNNYKEAVKERMSFIENGLKRNAYKLYREVSNGYD